MYERTSTFNPANEPEAGTEILSSPQAPATRAVIAAELPKFTRIREPGEALKTTNGIPLSVALYTVSPW